MTRTRRILSGTGIAYAHQAALLVLGLWLTPFLLRRVGQHSLGLWLVVSQILGYLSLLDLGVLALLPREIATASGLVEAEGRRRMAALVAGVRSIVAWQTLALAGLSASVWWWLPPNWVELRWPLAVVLVAFVLSYPLRVPAAVLQGLQELPFLSKTQFAGWAAGTGVTILLVVRGHGLLGLVIGWTIGQVAPAVAAWWYLRTRHAAVSSPREPASGSASPYLQRSLWVSISQVAQVLLSGSDVMLLARLLGPAAVVPYACTSKLVTVFANHPQLLMHAAQPALSELRASESKARLASVATALSQAMLIMSGAIMTVILPLNQFFVGWWIGPSQFGGVWLTVALVSMMLLRHWNVATVYTLFCFGYERQISLVSLADGVCTVVLTVVFVWKWGAIGAPLASIVSVVLISLPMHGRSVAHEMGLSSIAFMGSLAPLLVRLAAVAAVGSTVSIYFPVTTMAGVLTHGVPLALVYVALVGPNAWTGPLRPYIRVMIGLRNDIEHGAPDSASDAMPPRPVNIGVR